MTIKHFFALVELRTKVVSLSTCVLACLYTLWIRGSVDPLPTILLFAASLLIDMGTTAFNSYFDWFRNVDDPRWNRESDKVLVHEGVSPAAALAVGGLCFLAAAVAGFVLGLLTSLALLPVGLASMAVGFLYSAGPKPISSTPFGELFAGGFLGTVLFCIAVFAMGSRFDGSVILASLPQFFAIAAILAMNNACDREGDGRAGRKTVAVLVGGKSASRFAFALWLAGFVAVLVLAWYGRLPFIAVGSVSLAAVPACVIWLRAFRRGFSHETKGRSMLAIVRVFLLQTLGLAVALGAGIALGH